MTKVLSDNSHQPAATRPDGLGYAALCALDEASGGMLGRCARSFLSWPEEVRREEMSAEMFFGNKEPVEV